MGFQLNKRLNRRSLYQSLVINQWLFSPFPSVSRPARLSAWGGRSACPVPSSQPELGQPLSFPNLLLTAPLLHTRLSQGPSSPRLCTSPRLTVGISVADGCQRFFPTGFVSPLGAAGSSQPAGSPGGMLIVISTAAVHLGAVTTSVSNAICEAF